MEEIATDVGMGKASLYYYYPTKDDLFRAVITEEHEEFLDAVKTLMREDGCAPDRLKKYVTKRFEYFDRLLSLNLHELQGTVRSKPILAEMFKQFAAQELKCIHHILEEGRKSGDFGFTSPTHKLAEVFLHILQGLRLRFIRTMNGLSIEPAQYARFNEEIECVTDMFLRSIVGRPSRMRSHS